jgi:hypothetical protein
MASSGSSLKQSSESTTASTTLVASDAPPPKPINLKRVQTPMTAVQKPQPKGKSGVTPEAQPASSNVLAPPVDDNIDFSALDMVPTVKTATAEVPIDSKRRLLMSADDGDDGSGWKDDGDLSLNE